MVALRVLVVEDEEAVASLVGDILWELGYEPIPVRSAEAARLALVIEPVDVILLDIRLPLMSGLDFLRLGLPCGARTSEGAATALSEPPPGTCYGGPAGAQSRLLRHAPGIPVIAMSGEATDAEARECLRRGALDVLRKPVSAELLREVLRYAETRILDVQLNPAERAIDRRRSPRTAVDIPVRVVERQLAEWQGTSVDLCTFGLKVRRSAASSRRCGPAVRLVFAPADDGPALDLLSSLVRRERDAYVFRFVNVMDIEFRRLQDAVRRLTAAEPC